MTIHSHKDIMFKARSIIQNEISLCLKNTSNLEMKKLRTSIFAQSMKQIDKFINNEPLTHEIVNDIKLHINEPEQYGI